MRLWPRSTAVAVGCGIAFAVLTSAELAARRWWTRARFTDELVCDVADAELGSTYRANCRTRWRGRLGGRVYFDKAFSTDAFGRRVTPQSGMAARRRLVLFTGCSFTVGQGAADDETMPYFFGEASPGSRVLNYAHGGHGPQQALLRVERSMTPEALGSYDGRPLLVYVLISDHLFRASGARRFLGNYGAGFPSYAVRPDGGVALEGSFEHAHPWRTLLARWSQKSALLQRVPDPVTAADVELTARILAAVRSRFEGRFGSDRFVVFAYPGRRTAPYTATLERLRQLGVRVVDPNDLMTMSERRALTYPDFHPLPECHRRVGERLAADLRALGWLDDPAPAVSPPASR